MRKLLLPLSLISCLLFTDGRAQIVTTAAYFLRIPTSATINSMGRSGVALQFNDPFLALDNPAFMASFSSQTNLVYGSQYSTLFPELRGNLSLNNQAVAAGINLESLTNLPMKVQFTYTRRFFNLGENVRTTETGEELGRYFSYETANSITASVSYKYGAEWFLGAGYTRIYSRLNPFPADEDKDGISSGNAFSFGLLSRLPFHEWYTWADTEDQFYPEYFLNLGMSVLNKGDKLIYIDPVQADPLPKMAKIGYSVVFNYNLKYENTFLNLASFQWSADVNDLLVKRSSEFTMDYIDFPGDINVFKHVIGLKKDDAIELHRGYSINLLETVTIMQGWDDQIGFGETKTYGQVYSTSGLFKYLTGFTDNVILKNVLAESAITYSVSGVKSRLTTGTVYKGFSANFGFTF
ncbi:MAG: hypothetical protein J0L62_12425 [Bacteroidetes bacterium]|nr:hypothetical protein [Bacteroidota bacterium]